MPAAALFLILAAAALAPADRPILVTGYAGRPFISPIGEPFRAKSAIDDALERWFQQADRNQDNVLTADEMQTDAARFFAKLDSDGDGEIGPEEVIQYEWEVAPEIQVNFRPRRPHRNASANDEDEEARRKAVTAGIGGGLQGAARYALLNIPEPVSAADVNLDRSITLAEFRQAGLERFQLLDTNRSGRLSLEQLKALLPPIKARRLKRPDDSPDDRYGVPLPPADGQAK